MGLTYIQGQVKGDEGQEETLEFWWTAASRIPCCRRKLGDL